MAFTGYVFKNIAEVEPYLEDSETGPSIVWAKKQEECNYNSICCVDPNGEVGFGICMDLNPYKFKANFYDYEFAKYHLEQNTEIILCSMAWLKNKEDIYNTNHKVSNTVKYWAARLLPLHRDVKYTKRHTIFVGCNRTGLERGSEFAGLSCVMDISYENILILDNMKSDTIGVMVVEV
ncbi:MAG: hypothetical protein EXX96DRAFT_594629 [Benjaminiella poitrasii]|nr:MAG: hypothetical protein EXX96DRAFT_594629 [Benjaminiella poitrasii]